MLALQFYAGIFCGQKSWAQTTSSGLQTMVKAEDATIQKMGHATLKARMEMVTDELTLRVDTMLQVESVDWYTEPGTAKRMTARHRAEATDFFDKDSNWWWDIWWFTYYYPTVDANGEPLILSSLICMPDGDCDYVNNVVIGCHATITSNPECPSMRSKKSLSDTNDLEFLMLHASSGRVTHHSQDDMPYYNLVVLPDYEGYGVSIDRAHPYLSEELTARHVVDAVRYGLALYQTSPEVDEVRHPFRDEWRSFSVGYSQGGSSAMAVHRFIEQNDLAEELHFAGSICGGGPYAPTTTLMNYTQDAIKGRQMSMAVVMPLILKGMCDSNPYMRNHGPADYMSSRFLETGIIGWLESKEMSHSTIKSNWDNLLKSNKAYWSEAIEEDGVAYLEKVMIPETFSYLQNVLEATVTELPAGYTNDPFDTDGVSDYDLLDERVVPLDPLRPTHRGVMEDLHLALESNDMTKGWNPEHPLYLYHSYKDDVVTLANRTKAWRAFGDWALCKNAGVHAGHKATALEFLMGSEEPSAVEELAKSEVCPVARPLGTAEVVYKGVVTVDGTDVKAEYLIRQDAEGHDVAVLGSGYNACISQYRSGKVEVPATVTLDGTTYDVAAVNNQAFRMCTEITYIALPEGITRVGDFAFQSCHSLCEVVLPATLTTIGTGAFIDLPSLQMLTVKAAVPPAWEYNDVFSFHDDGIGDSKTYTYDTPVLYVTSSSAETYAETRYSDAALGWTTAEGWANFKNVCCLDETVTGISNVKSTVQGPDAVWFTIGGTRLIGRPTHRGVYIKGGKDHKVKIE